MTDPLLAPGPSRPGNFIYLFVALLILTVVGPVMEVSLGPIGGLFAEISLSLALLVALWSLRSTRRLFAIGVALIGVNILATATWMLRGDSLAAVVGHLSGLAFLALTATEAVRAILRPGPVGHDKVIGALCVYLLLGIAWAEAYQLLFAYDPGSFSGVELQRGHALSWRFLYFSFVTLTTLGYGDVLPLTIYAQTMTVAETVIGQFYLAVLVAALVSSYLQGDRGEAEVPVRDPEPDPREHSE